MSYRLVPFKSKKLKDIVFAIDEADYDDYITRMPSWFLSGAKNNYVTCDWRDCPGGRKKIRLHRFMLLGINDDQTIVVDHINGDTLDNRRCNLRVLSKSANVSHRANVNSNNTSGHRGIHWCKTSNRWIACIQHNNVDWWKQSFTDKEEAIKMIDEKRKVYNLLYGISEKYVQRLDDLVEPNRTMKELYENSNYKHNKHNPEQRSAYDAKRRQITADKRDMRKKELLSMEQTLDTVNELRRIEGDERRSQSKISGKRMTEEEKKANINEGRRLRGMMMRQAERERLLSMDQNDEIVQKKLKKLEKAEKLALAKI